MPRAGRALLAVITVVVLLVLIAGGPRLPAPHESWRRAGHVLTPDPSWTFKMDKSWKSDPSWERAARRPLKPAAGWDRR